ncbi:MAG: hypothetical protein AAFO28_06535 [Pseudomonadota bacterium]
MIRIGVRDIAARLGIVVALFSAFLAPGLALGLAPGAAVAQELADPPAPSAKVEKAAPATAASVAALDPAPSSANSEIPPLISTAAFASRAPFWDYDLSPDGTAMTLFQPNKDKL